MTSVVFVCEWQSMGGESGRGGRQKYVEKRRKDGVERIRRAEQSQLLVNIQVFNYLLMTLFYYIILHIVYYNIL